LIISVKTLWNAWLKQCYLNIDLVKFETKTIKNSSQIW